MRRVSLLVAAALFFVWENVAAARWLAAHDGLGAGLAHAWATLRQDALVLLVWTDLAVFALLAIAWLARDTRARALSPARRAGWLVGTVLIGSPVLLTYLAFRPAPSDAT